MEETARIHTSGSRKTSVARAFLKPGSGSIFVNKKPLADYFHRQTLVNMVLQPLILTDSAKRFDLSVTVRGGGIAGQAGAVRHAIARALLRSDPDLHTALKKADLLTRDPRVKERKKYGLKRARKASQYRKR